MGKIIEFPQKSIIPDHLPQTEELQVGNGENEQQKQEKYGTCGIQGREETAD